MRRGCYPAGFLTHSVEGVTRFFETASPSTHVRPHLPRRHDGNAAGLPTIFVGAASLERRHEFPEMLRRRHACWGNVQAFCVAPGEIDQQGQGVKVDMENAP